MDFCNVKSLTIPEGEVKQIDISGVTVWKKTEGMPAYLCFTAEEAGSTVRMIKIGRPAAISLETSPDGNTWTAFNPTSTIITLANVGDKVYFRGNNQKFSSSFMAYYSFDMTGRIAASGNIMSLLDATVMSTVIAARYCFCCLFEGCTSLTSAPLLPAITLADYCYMRMFGYCTGLKKPPELQAISLTQFCYSGMFDNCSSIRVFETQVSEDMTAYRIPTVGDGTSGDYSLNEMFVNTGGTFTGTPDINKTYYIAN